MADDPFQLQRFTDAQDETNVYERALSELRAGRKTSHWMWFVFPQIEPLFRQVLDQYFDGIADEATERRL
jgi:uncharacterized protein (DUF1810 family)